jgi:transposase InsO family protein
VRHRAEHKDHVWAWDFIFDRTERGRSIKWLSIIDEYTRECLALEVDRRMKSHDVLDVLRELFVIRGVPRCIRSDNGPEFIAEAIRTFLEKAEVRTLYIELAHRGRTAMPRASTVGSAASYWTARCSRAWLPLSRWPRVGEATTTTTGPTARWTI